MPAPLVIPMAENITTFTTFAEKANQVSENKWKLEVNRLETLQNEKLNRMNKEMNQLKYELSKAKHTGDKVNKLNHPMDKADKLPVSSRTSPISRTIRRNSISSSEDSDTSIASVSDKKSAKVSKSKAERNEHERINNLHRRYSCQLGNGQSNVSKINAAKRGR